MYKGSEGNESFNLSKYPKSADKQDFYFIWLIGGWWCRKQLYFQGDCPRSFQCKYC